ncbi:Disease resistance protein RPS5 [Rhynchospora pubera]|uniref:Disease resistance protein RPS5 n=1 Tax=Rhynchospora pubera TaxID=906938 RepID=A0AAV8FNS3_9POAL|nr:Disease resistance protein RPS5 [Rhynchospora pubera]
MEGSHPKDVFPRLQYLEFRLCTQLTSISWVVNLPCIRELSLDCCSSVKQLIQIDELKSSGVEVSQYSFPSLKIIWLRTMELERISDPIISFPALEFLNVIGSILKELPFKYSNLPRKLKWIQGDEEWWNNIEMEDADKSSLQPFFKKR